METTRSIINQNVYDSIEFYTAYVMEHGEEAEYLGIKLMEEPEKFVKGAYIHSAIRLYLHYNTTGDEREQSALDRVIYGIRLLENDTLKTWGKLNALRGLCALYTAGKLDIIPEDCLEILKDRTDIGDFYDRETNTLKGAATNYYQVAMACAGYRELIGWGIDGECDRIKDKLLSIMQNFSAEGWMDEQPPYGRYDRYSILISAELIDTLNSINKDVPEFAIKNLKDAYKLAVACANSAGDGVLYGRSLSVHGDCAMLELLSTAFRMGIVEEEDKEVALSYCGAILKKTFDFWYDKNRNSYNIWFDGRTTNNYRQVRRLLEVNLDMAIHMLTTFDNMEAAGCVDLQVDNPLPESPYGFNNPYKTVFADGRGEERVLYNFVENGKLYQLPLIGAGYMARNAAYLPFPVTAERIEGNPETKHPFMVPYFADGEGNTYIPSGFYKGIADCKLGDTGTVVVAKGNMSMFNANINTVAESNIPFTASYVFDEGKITVTYEAHTETPLTCSVLYAYGEKGCGVTFNGTTPEETSVKDDPAYFTPHGGCIAKREYTEETNKLQIVITL